jgi:hypothetical protein
MSSFRRFLGAVALAAAVKFAPAHAQVGADTGAIPTPDNFTPATFVQSQKGFLGRMREEVSLGYYMSLLGPSPGLGWGETYNVFRQGPAPYQLLHAANLRWQINPDWAIGASLAFTNEITKKVRTGSYLWYGATPAENQIRYYYNRNEAIWYNARAYVAVPALSWNWATLFSTFSVELPTSNDSRKNDMLYGLVAGQNLALRLPWPRFSGGITTQLVHYNFEKDVLPPPCTGCFPVNLQTTLVNISPYLNYALAPAWQIASQLTVDWDQTGRKNLTEEFNNNLPHRWRVALNRFFLDSPFTHVGVNVQGLLDPIEARSTAFGFDFSMRF